MSSTSGTKKPKGPKLPEKTYLPDSDSDEDAFDFSFLDFSEETFKAPSRLYDGDIPSVQQKEHAHLDEDNEDVGVEYRVYDPNVDWKEMRPRLGDCYESPAQLRDNNDNNKMQCPFRVAVGWKYNERTFQIKFCNEMHLCARNYHFGSLVTSSWLAKHYLKDVIMKPKMTLLEMQADVLQRFSVSVSLGQCQRARATAMGMIEGKLEDHYAKNKDNWTWFIDNLVADLDLGAGNGLVVISDQHKIEIHKIRAKEFVLGTCYEYSGSVTPRLWLEEEEEERNKEKWCKAKIQAGEIPEQQQIASRAIHTTTSSRVGSGLRSDAVSPGLRSDAVSSGLRSDAVSSGLRSDAVNSGLRSDAASSGLRSDAVGKAQYVLYMYCMVVDSGGDVFETRHGYNGYKVDLANHTCTYNLWMLSGIPCVHSEVAINYVHKDPSEFISSWFHKDKYVATYSQNIQPVGGSNLWPMTEFIKPLPPPS
uniref:Zinc finger PMZ-type domain-containing protein n=1 Tax=Lactuca sativa TaxID=4236 RepID=A0A9R1X269_LACSA|nr:hypothetical protein LSAT_V11C800447190 [Lactuca sativa]